MQFDSQEQKTITMKALNELNVRLGEASQILQIIQPVIRGEIVIPKKPKIKKDSGISAYLASIFNLLLASELDVTIGDIDKSKKSQIRTKKLKRRVRSFDKGLKRRKAVEL